MTYVLRNGEIIPRKDVSIDIEDRAYQFGDGIYEVIGVYEGKPFRMNEHLERLKRSANAIRIPLPYDVEELKNKLEQLMVKNKLSNGIIYVQISRGVSSPRNHPFPNPPVNPEVVGYTMEPKRLSEEIYREGVPVLLVEDIRWLRCDIKSLNLLPNVLAKQEAVEKQCFEAILQRGETITEGSSSNVFAVKDGKLYTHPANHLILNGITRCAVIEVARGLGLEVIEEPFSKEFLLEADEVFITGTYIDIVPVRSVNDKWIGAGKAKTITRKLQEGLNRMIFQQP